MPNIQQSYIKDCFKRGEVIALNGATYPNFTIDISMIIRTAGVGRPTISGDGIFGLGPLTPTIDITAGENTYVSIDGLTLSTLNFYTGIQAFHYGNKTGYVRVSNVDILGFIVGIEMQGHNISISNVNIVHNGPSVSVDLPGHPTTEGIACIQLRRMCSPRHGYIIF